jgi:hypothetical protein
MDIQEFEFMLYSYFIYYLLGYTSGIYSDIRYYIYIYIIEKLYFEMSLDEILDLP